MFMQDIEVMYAWEHAFSDKEVRDWIDENIRRYEIDGFSYFAAVEKSTGGLAGVQGPLIEKINGEKYIGIGYIFKKEYWGRGLASEGVKACIKYAFERLHADKVIAEIRPGNTSSRKVAKSAGMKITGEFIKCYNGKDMPHLIYSLENPLKCRLK